MKLTVTELNFYPVKSCAGISLQRGRIGLRGIEGDREWMVVDENGKFVTQRTVRELALIEPSILDDGSLKLETRAMPPLMVPVCTQQAAREVMVWDDRCLAFDQGQEAAEWLKMFLGKPFRLVKMDPEFVRKVDSEYATSENDQVGLADGYPLLLISQASLADLNAHLVDPVPMNQFRPNVVVAGCEPYAEDNWRRIQIGSVELSLVKRCSRCVIVNVNQTTAVARMEVLKTLAGYRQEGDKVFFGQNLIHGTTGEIAVGDAVEVLQ